MEVMTVKNTSEHGNYKYSLMGSGDEATHLHVNNIYRNGSVIIPLSAISELLRAEEAK